MSEPADNRNRHGESREEIAKREIGHTEIRRTTAILLCLLLVVPMAGVPLRQLLLDRGAGRPPAFSLVRSGLRHAGRRLVDRSQQNGPLASIMAANRVLLASLQAEEKAIADGSWLTATALPPMQWLFTGLLGVGNEEAYIGRDGWLFYRPDLEHVMGQPFLHPHMHQGRRAAGGSSRLPPQPDPTLAILHLARQLEGRGIRLVVVPIPVKPAIHPERFSRRCGAASPADNPSMAAWIDELRHPAGYIKGRLGAVKRVAANPAFAGLGPVAAALRDAGENDLRPLVYDPTARLMARKQSNAGEAQYLHTDTHWTHAAMDAVAGDLAAFLRREVRLPAAPASAPRAERVVTNRGDIAALLRLPEGRRIEPESVSVLVPEAVPAGAGAVLLLGDSFANIYSQEALGWGGGAGLAETLAWHLGLPVRRIAINAGGAHAAPVELAAQLRRGDADPLDGVQVVVWSFASRELSSGDWRTIDLPAAATSRPAASRAERMLGRIAAITRPPDPAKVTYADAVIALHVKAEAGAAVPEALVYTWGMRQRAWTAAGRWQEGDRVTLQLTPWAEAIDSYGRFQRVDPDDPALFDLPCYWGEPVTMPPTRP